MKTLKLWIARDKDGELYLYIGEKPYRQGDTFYPNPDDDYFELRKNLFPEVTFDNSPQQVELKICNEYDK